MPAGLPTAVRRQWRAVVKDLVERELPMPPPAVLAGHARTLARQLEVAAALDREPIGTPTWKRLLTAEGELAKQVSMFCREYCTEAAAPDTGYQADDGYDPSSPFAWAGRG